MAGLSRVFLRLKSTPQITTMIGFQMKPRNIVSLARMLPKETTYHKHLLQRVHYLKTQSRLYFKRKEPQTLSDGSVLIYRAPMMNYVNALHLTFVVSTLAWVALVAFYVRMDKDPWSEEMSEYIENTTQAVTYLGSLLFLLFIFSVALRRYPITIYFDAKNGRFTVMLLKLFSRSRRHLTFGCGEMSIDRTFMGVPARFLPDYYKVKGHRLIMLESYIRSPYYYNLMMGYETFEDEEDGDT